MCGIEAPARIRVLHVITSLGIGGAERLVVSAARGLSPARFDHGICCLSERGPLAAEAEAAGVPGFCVGGVPGVRPPPALPRLGPPIPDFPAAILPTPLPAAEPFRRLPARPAPRPVVVAPE